MNHTAKGKVILVTGATDGIGYETARELKRRGATLLVHGRNESRLKRTVTDLESLDGAGEVRGYRADFSSLEQVRSMADRILEREERLHVLINNAGVYMTEREESEEGYEMTFAVNHLAPFLLTLRLRELLQKSAPSRVVNVASLAHQGSRMDPDNLQGQREWSAYSSYSLSKLCNILFTRELARRLEGTGVVTNSLHPGVISTKLLHAGFAMSGASVREGARTSLFLALSDEGGEKTGRYFSSERETQPSGEAQDDSAARRLWEISERLTGEVWES